MVHFDRMERYSDAELSEVYSKCIEVLAGERRGELTEAAAMHMAILKEWAERGQTATSNKGFKWRTIRQPEGIIKLEKLNAPDEGMLSACGYHVGKTKGKSQTVRQLILDDIFLNDLPPVNGPSYMNKWGRPGTQERLKQLNLVLAYFGTNELGNGHLKAAQDREDDLRYLYSKYYVKRFEFHWTHIRRRPL